MGPSKLCEENKKDIEAHVNTVIFLSYLYTEKSLLTTKKRHDLPLHHHKQAGHKLIFSQSSLLLAVAWPFPKTNSKRSPILDLSLKSVIFSVPHKRLLAKHSVLTLNPVKTSPMSSFQSTESLLGSLQK